MKHLIHKILKEEFENKPNIFVPHNLDKRREMKQNNLKLKLMDKVIEGDLTLLDDEVDDLGNIEIINGSLTIRGEKITSLNRLRYVNGSLDIRNTNIEDLGHLYFVKSDIFIIGTPVAKKYTYEEIMNKIKCRRLLM
jgi:hypothetical protein